MRSYSSRRLIAAPSAMAWCANYSILFGGSPQLLVSNLLESGTITLRDLKVLQNAAGKRGPRSKERA